MWITENSAVSGMLSFSFFADLSYDFPGGSCGFNTALHIQALSYSIEMPVL
jgi:hypothetical protein